MRNIKLTIQYDGTNYCGWQRQENGISVQEELENAVLSVTGSACAVTGASRTDSGVHSLGQTANFKTESGIPSEKLRLALNSVLPADIFIENICEVKPSFHAQKSARSKIYRYRLFIGPKCPPLERNSVVCIPYKLDVRSMKKAASFITGRHNFLAFTGSKCSVKDHVRRVKYIKIKKHGSYVDIDIEADGFLFNMVRVIAGVLVETGRGKMSPEAVKEIRDGKMRINTCPTAPAKGLVLLEVKY